MELLFPWTFFDILPDLSPNLAQEQVTEREKEQLLFCWQCGFRITDAKQKIAKKGTHQHAFFNPHGIVFHIGCFANAPGCRAQGPLSAEFSWFPSYQWRIECCASCQNHLGWSFTQTDDLFYGLILNRLREEERSA